MGRGYVQTFRSPSKAVRSVGESGGWFRRRTLITNSDDSITCVSCLAQNKSVATFCEECGAPIGATATIDPLQTIRTEAFLLDKAIQRPPRLIVLLGIWLVHFPVLVASIGVAIYMILYGSGITGFLFFWVMIALCCYAVVVLYRVTRNYLVIPKKEIN